MDLDKKQPIEHVEAVPGPAIVITKEAFEEMQKRNKQLPEKERLEMYEKLFKNIKDETKLPEDNEPSL